MVHSKQQPIEPKHASSTLACARRLAPTSRCLLTPLPQLPAAQQLQPCSTSFFQHKSTDSALHSHTNSTTASTTAAHLSSQCVRRKPAAGRSMHRSTQRVVAAAGWLRCHTHNTHKHTHTHAHAYTHTNTNTHTCTCLHMHKRSRRSANKRRGDQATT